MRKVIVKIAIVMILIAFIYPIKSQAGLQANKNGTSLTTQTAGSANNLFIGIRNMEAYYGTLGKNAIIDTTTYLENGAEEGKGNGLDCHMAKNTEWGTIAMLSASSYGEAPNGVNATATTTGNESGVCQMANGTGTSNSSKGYELVAGIWTGKTSDQYIGKIASADGRYYDLYTGKTSKAGDSTTETAGWKGSSGNTFIESGYPIFVREYSKGLFGYSNHDGCGNNSYYDNIYAGSRAVVVFGEGL